MSFTLTYLILLRNLLIFCIYVLTAHKSEVCLDSWRYINVIIIITITHCDVCWLQSLSWCSERGLTMTLVTEPLSHSLERGAVSGYDI